MGDFGRGDFGRGDFDRGDFGRAFLEREVVEDTFSVLTLLLLRGGEGGRVEAGGDLGLGGVFGQFVRVGDRERDRLPDGLLLPYNSLKPLWRHLKTNNQFIFTYL